MNITRLVPWFGANSKCSEKPAELLADCTWVGILFAGSMAEVRHFAPVVQLLVNDLHHNLITLARIAADPTTNAALRDRLSRKLFHPAELDDALAILQSAAEHSGPSLFRGGEQAPDDMTIAEAYFTVAWMGRSAVVGTRGESSVGLAIRYDAGGGDSVTRYRSAVESLEAWQRVLHRCQFTEEDAFAIIGRILAKEQGANFKPSQRGNRLGLYLDPPWPDDGDSYVHAFTVDQQRRLARDVSLLKHTRVVLRYGDHPLIRELYPESDWEWHEAEGRDQHRNTKAEVFLRRRT